METKPGANVIETYVLGQELAADDAANTCGIYR